MKATNPYETPIEISARQKVCLRDMVFKVSLIFIAIGYTAMGIASLASVAIGDFFLFKLS